jgi:hypothetical protein
MASNWESHQGLLEKDEHGLFERAFRKNCPHALAGRLLRYDDTSVIGGSRWYFEPGSIYLHHKLH